MNVSLTPELESLVTTKVESGMYNSASEVIREGLRLLHERDEIRRVKIKGLKKEVQTGKDALIAGKFTDYDTAEDLINDIRQEGRERIARQKKR